MKTIIGWDKVDTSVYEEQAAERRARGEWTVWVKTYGKWERAGNEALTLLEAHRVAAALRYTWKVTATSLPLGWTPA